MAAHSPTSPVANEAKNDPRVKAAVRRLANAAVELHLSLAALGADHPRLGNAVMTLFPRLADEAIKDGRSREFSDGVDLAVDTLRSAADKTAAGGDR